MIFDWKRKKEKYNSCFFLSFKSADFQWSNPDDGNIFHSSVKHKQTNQDYVLLHSRTWKNLSSRKTRTDSAVKPVLEIEYNVITYSNWDDIKIMLSLILYINLKCKTFTLSKFEGLWRNSLKIYYYGLKKMQSLKDKLTLGLFILKGKYFKTSHTSSFHPLYIKRR